MKWLPLALLVMVQGCCSRSPGTLAIKDTVESGIIKQLGHSLGLGRIDYAEFSPNRKLMAAVNNKSFLNEESRSYIWIYEVGSWDQVKYNMDFPMTIRKVALDDEVLLALVVTDDQVLEWDLETREVRQVAEIDQHRYRKLATEAVRFRDEWSVFFTRGPELRINADGSVSKFDVPENIVEALEYKDGRVLACGDGLIQVRSSSEKIIQRIWYSKSTLDIDISPGGNRVAAVRTGDGCYFGAVWPRVVAVWDLDSGRKLYTFRSDYSDLNEIVYHCSFVSEDSVLIGTDQRILVVDVEFGDVTRAFVAESDTWLGRDGQLLADGTYATVDSNGVDIYSFSP